MSGGPVGNGISYWGTIKVSGTLNAQDLADLKTALNALITGQINGKNIDGSLEKGAHVSDNNTSINLNVTW